ncbi:uncharacterized protein METZ01_LOCUS311591, partial [marine metagenome]
MSLRRALPFLSFLVLAISVIASV